MLLVGEADEVADEFKKPTCYPNYKGNTDKLIDKLGDVRWYLEARCKALNISMNELEKQNLEKLKRRYNK